MTLKETPLSRMHESLGASMTEYNGWMLPINYGGLVDEHRATRTCAGLFDVSHMGRILVFGEQAQNFLNGIVTNDISSHKSGRCVYTLMLNERGGVADDLMAYKYNPEYFMLVVNAATTSKDLNILGQRAKSYLEGLEDGRGCEDPETELCIRDVSESTAMISLQGPKSEKILSNACESPVSGIKRFGFDPEVIIADSKVLVSRTGYTGEDGFEILSCASDAAEIWDEIYPVGKELGMLPCGLGARDTLRLEAGLMLYGQDLDDDTLPANTPVQWTVKMDKPDFTGKQALKKALAEGYERRLIGLRMLDRSIPRRGYPIIFGGDEAGHITSGTHSPTLGYGIALAWVQKDLSNQGDDLKVGIRGAEHPARMVQLPFYSR